MVKTQHSGVIAEDDHVLLCLLIMHRGQFPYSRQIRGLGSRGPKAALIRLVSALLEEGGKPDWGRTRIIEFERSIKAHNCASLDLNGMERVASI